MRAVVVAIAAAVLAVVVLRAGRIEWRSGAREQPPGRLKQATFAAGCFWGVEAAFAKIDGVVATSVGYCGGHTKDPTYRQISTGTTGHAESVRVTYDPAKVSYAELLDVFWSWHDPTIDHDQGPQRSIIFFHDAQQESIARASLREVSNSQVFKGKIVTEILPASPFYPAEEDHQHYYQKQGITPTCRIGAKEVHTHLAARAAQARQSKMTRSASADVRAPSLRLGRVAFVGADNDVGHTVPGVANSQQQQAERRASDYE